MALQESVAVRNTMNDARETAVGASPRLQIRTGTPPANCGLADTGTLLIEITLPADWLTASVSGLKQKNGTWSGTAAGAGTAAHFRIKDNSGATTHMQGTCSATGGGGDMILDNASIAAGQTVTVNQFDITRGNA
jgi:hypothetical protein